MRPGLALVATLVVTLVVAVAAALAVSPSFAQTGGSTSPRKAGKRDAAPAPKVDYARRYADQCAVCHGADGRAESPDIPVLAGQHAFYAITQLFLFREGRRSNAAMTAVGKTMSDDDLRGFSEHIGTLPPVPPPAPPPVDAARMRNGELLAQQHRCTFCHGADLAGGQQVPRLAGQHEPYLRGALNEFRAGKRTGYTPAMLDPTARLSADDVDVLAYYLNRFRGPAAALPPARR